MAFQAITNSEIQQGAPIDSGLLGKVKSNDDNFNSVDISQASLIASLQSSLDGLLNKTDDNLVGETKYLITTTAPNGFIPANGVTIGLSGANYNGTTYYQLYQKLWPMSLNTAGQPYYLSAAKGATADADWSASKTILIDESGLFIRAYKSGTTNGVGQLQTDAFQGHYHSFYYSGGQTYAGGTFEGTVRPISANTSTGQPNVQSPVTDGTNGTPRTALETRPSNIAKYIYIRYSNKVIL